MMTPHVMDRATAEACARLICPHCQAAHPHRQLAESSISGARTRVVFDLHERPNVGGAELVECWAAAIWEQLDAGGDRPVAEMGAMRP